MIMFVPSVVQMTFWVNGIELGGKGDLGGERGG